MEQGPGAVGGAADRGIQLLDELGSCLVPSPWLPILELRPHMRGNEQVRLLDLAVPRCAKGGAVGTPPRPTRAERAQHIRLLRGNLLELRVVGLVGDDAAAVQAPTRIVHAILQLHEAAVAAHVLRAGNASRPLATGGRRTSGISVADLAPPGAADNLHLLRGERRALACGVPRDSRRDLGLHGELALRRRPEHVAAVAERPRGHAQGALTGDVEPEIHLALRRLHRLSEPQPLSELLRAPLRLVAHQFSGLRLDPSAHGLGASLGAALRLLRSPALRVGPRAAALELALDDLAQGEDGRGPHQLL
mmetsp:Transcript_133467/g.386326  ORF Transcript_133467/g.386326 Transcript_133467/m.386326 type:complete len:306 (-) Transcript_133467:52-969(-)